MFKNNWVKGLGVFVLFVVIALGNIARGQTPTPTPQTGHTITVINSCSQTVWVGIQSSVLSDGFELNSKDQEVVTVPIGWTSGTIWARTGCTFNSSGVCPTPGPNSIPPANCCDTGGCTDSSGNFVINCVNGPNPPATIAEFTMDGGGVDTYDVSMVSGSNVSVEIVPDSSTYDLTKGEDPAMEKCKSDSDCNQKSAFTNCDTNLNNGSGFCVNPFYCASPGCTESSGCAADGFDKSFLSSSTWGATSCTTNSDCGSNATCVSGKCKTDFAINEVQCTPVTIGTGMNTDTIDLQFKNQQNQGTDYVGCITPQKFCRTPCTTDNDCPAPQTCDTSAGFCTLNGEILGAPCDSTSIPCTSDSDCVDSSGNVPGMCDTTTNTCTGGTATSFDQLWGCTGVNAASCFTPDVNNNCCGCPTWAPSSLCANHNPEWQTVAEPIFTIFQNAAPPVYTFPYDDAIATYTCSSGSTDNVTAYTVTFCPQDSDLDNDGIPNDTENSGGGNALSTIGAVDINENETTVARQQVSLDTDEDGIPNRLDLDSDGDGESDIIEAGGIDADGNGMIDNFADSDGDGLDDSVDPDQGGTPLPVPDSDGDGIPNFLDASDTSGTSGCSIVSAGATLSIPLFLVIPVFILIRRLWRRYMS